MLNKKKKKNKAGKKLDGKLTLKMFSLETLAQEPQTVMWAPGPCGIWQFHAQIPDLPQSKTWTLWYWLYDEVLLCWFKVGAWIHVKTSFMSDLILQDQERESFWKYFLLLFTLNKVKYDTPVWTIFNLFLPTFSSQANF